MPAGCSGGEAAAGDDVCAVMLELVQGEGGVLPLEPAYVQAVKKLCEERDWLLLVDEVMSAGKNMGSQSSNAPEEDM